MAKKTGSTTSRDQTPKAPKPSVQVEKGITRRHSRQCGLRGGEACSCRPTYQAQAWSAPDKKPVRRTFSTISEARRWRQEAQVDLRRREMGAPSSTLLREAAEDWLDSARAGVVRTRSGESYKPSAIRSYESSLRRFSLPVLGNRRLSAVDRHALQDLVDQLVGEGLAPSTVGNAILPLRAIYRRAKDREQVAVNPTLGLSLPSERRGRDRVAPPREVSALLAALPEHHKPLWATAIYAGLRRGELQALRWPDIDLQAGILRVEKSWDRLAGLIEPKSRSGQRSVPIPGALRSILASHHLQGGRVGDGFAFSSTAERPFDPPNAIRVAKRAWTRAGLKPISFHECRHTYASLMIAAGVNLKALSAYMGHSSITVTLDRYGHLMPGNEREAARLFDAYLEQGRPGRLGLA